MLCSCLNFNDQATQQARANERKTAESKYRLTSYVFHEIRVPLNAARASVFSFPWLRVLNLIMPIVLAVQNLEASGTVSKEFEFEFDALMGSLTMMSKGSGKVPQFRTVTNLSL